MALVTDRWYCTLNGLKSELGETTTANDARLSRYIAQASRAIEEYTGRTFIPVTATKYFDAPADGCKLFLCYEDLLTLTTLTDDTGTITSTYYWLYPLNMRPKHSIVLDTGSLGRGFQYDQDPQRTISIAGVWGYCDDYAAPGLTLAVAVTTTTATTITLSASTCEVGWTLLVDSEAMFVSGVSGTVATVQRGANGTTAATHLIGATVYRYTPPADVEIACISMAAYANNVRTAAGVRRETIGEYTVEYGSADSGGGGIPAAAAATLRRYQRIGV